MQELANIVVEEVKRVTGFDRVMFYRFNEVGDGSVDAESVAPGLEPYLGLHYPASDIPQQARRLYLENRLRIIADARSQPARIVPTLRPDTGAPLDLSFAVLRSVSPIHLEYMANMGLRASMSIALVVRDRLWGLISCANHTGPRPVAQDVRVACEFLGRLTSLQIDALEDREAAARRASSQATASMLSDTMRTQDDATDNVLERLLARSSELLRLVDAEGVAVVRGHRGAGNGRAHTAACVHPGNRQMARGPHEPVLHCISGDTISRGRGGQGPRQRPAHVRVARPAPASTTLVPARDREDGDLGRRSWQARQARRTRCVYTPGLRLPRGRRKCGSNPIRGRTAISRRLRIFAGMRSRSTSSGRSCAHLERCSLEMRSLQ